MENLIELIKTWGYLAVFLGATVEGESVILTASSLAALGYLSLPRVMIVAFIGTLIADQGLYLVGRHYGPAIFDRFSYLKKSADRAFKLLNRYDTLFIIACRFIYGIRITSAIVIGASGIPLRRFVPLNVLSAAIWAVISCVGGYLLGDVMYDILTDFDRMQRYVFIGIGILLIIIGLIFAAKKFLKKYRNGKMPL